MWFGQFAVCWSFCRVCDLREVASFSSSLSLKKTGCQSQKENLKCEKKEAKARNAWRHLLWQNKKKKRPRRLQVFFRIFSLLYFEEVNVCDRQLLPVAWKRHVQLLENERHLMIFEQNLEENLFEFRMFSSLGKFISIEMFVCDGYVNIYSTKHRRNGTRCSTFINAST